MRILPPRASRRVTVAGLLLLMACGGSGGSGDDGAPWILVEPNPSWVAYMDDVESGRAVAELMPLRHRDVDVARARGSGPPSPRPPPNVGGLCSFPAKYDLRALNRVTPARENVSKQYCGTCWTSATMGSLESFLAPAKLWDFSENHLQLHWGSDGASCGTGGNPRIATYCFAAWRGPVDEDDFDLALAPPGSATGLVPVRQHVQNVFFLPDRQGPLDNCWIKLAVTHLGGVYSAISRTSWSENWSTYQAYYHPTAGVIHAVTIVGWDDDFDRTKFYCGDPSVPDALQVPAGNGAFLVKDNGGPNWMDQGFFWVSYYDGSIGTMMAAFTAEAVGNYGRMYQHDPYGPTDYLVLPGARPEGSWQGNVFTAKEDEWLAAVSFYEQTEGSMDYHIEVHLDPVTGPTRPGTPAATADVSLLMPGYFTVVLPQKVLLQAGQKFGVVLRGHNRDGTWESPLCIERPGPGYSKVKAGPGQSFVSVDGSTWQDLTKVQVPVGGGASETLTDTNLCIKAFTMPVVSASASLLPVGQAVAWEIVNDGAEDAWVQPEARLRANVGGVFEDIGDPIHAQRYVEEASDVMDTFEGWVRVPAGGRVTAFSADGTLGPDVQVASRLNRLDPVTSLLLNEGLVEYLNDLLNDPLMVTAADPANGSTMPVPLVSVITLTFDEPAKIGPGILGITVTSGSDVRNVFATVNGNQLQVIPSKALNSKELGGTTWHVHVPSDAAVSQALGNPLSSDYGFSFTVSGVN